MNNQPAFPIFPGTGGGHTAAFKDMTLRDYFAAKAMQNVFMTGGDDDERRYIAMHAYKMADAMLKAREA
jgi:hypothetical protein